SESPSSGLIWSDTAMMIATSPMVEAPMRRNSFVRMLRSLILMKLHRSYAPCSGRPQCAHVEIRTWPRRSRDYPRPTWGPDLHVATSTAAPLGHGRGGEVIGCQAPRRARGSDSLSSPPAGPPTARPPTAGRKNGLVL